MNRDVVVNIRGNSEQLKRELDSVEQRSSSPRSSVLGSESVSNRLLDAVRAEITSQRANNAKDAIEAVRAAETVRIRDTVNARYAAAKDDVYDRMEVEHAKVDATPGKTPLWYERRHDEVDAQFQPELDSINNRMAAERSKAEEELTAALRELTNTIGNKNTRQTTTEGSYIGQLQSERRRLVLERDLAPTREGAVNAQSRISGIDEELKDVLGGGRRPDGRRDGNAVWDPAQMLIGASGQLISAADSGDVGDIVSGVGTAGAALMGGGLKAVMKRLVWVEAARQAANLFTSSGKLADDAYSISRYRSTENATGRLGANRVINNANHELMSSMGLTYEEFIQRSNAQIRARGTTDNYHNNTLESIALERSSGLDEGALIRGAVYDRYQDGRNGSQYGSMYGVNYALSELITVLSRISGSGVSQNDFSRVQEKYDIQQGIMSSFMNISDRPQYEDANRLVAGFSAISGITQDARLGNDIQSYQNALQNPGNDRMRAILYNTVGDLYAGTDEDTGYQTHIIDQYLHDPSKQAAIMQAYMQRLQSMYGDMSTSMGYWSLRSVFPDIAPDRLMKESEALGDPDSQAATILRDGLKSLETGRGDRISTETMRNQGAMEREGMFEAIAATSSYGKFISNYWKDFKSSLGEVLNGRGNGVALPEPPTPWGGTGK